MIPMRASYLHLKIMSTNKSDEVRTMTPVSPSGWSYGGEEDISHPHSTDEDVNFSEMENCS
jgi:hypothetical protein